jgi:hypothetical protein
MTEKTPGTEPVCYFPGCEQPAAPETAGVLEVCPEHAAAMDASSDVEAWEVALGVLRPWVQTTEAIGFDDKLTQVMRHALMEAEAEAELARGELERAKAALL